MPTAGDPVPGWAACLALPQRANIPMWARGGRTRERGCLATFPSSWYTVLMDPPAWAMWLTRVGAAEHGRRPPVVVWRTGRRRRDRGGQLRRSSGASGDCWGNAIRIFAGRDTADARATLLHELAHWLTWEEVAAHGWHWRAVFLGLCRRHRVPVRLRT